mmetsp:Transcript_15034/g.34125  ORF Transcript_15034/g.34125 Transcript_15034/m.34125 type:complete len:784 (+) Transcript_15034:156-2507(+)
MSGFEGWGGQAGSPEGSQSRRQRTARGSHRSGQKVPSGRGGHGRDPHAGHGTSGGPPPSRESGTRGDASGPDQAGNELLTAVADHLEARDISSASRALTKLSRLENASSLRSNRKLHDVLSRLHGQLHAADMNVWPNELADITLSLCKFQLNDPMVVELLKRIADIAKYQADKFAPHDIAGLVWGFANMMARNESLMSVIAAEVVNKVGQFDQRELSNTAWAFAKCGLWNEQLVCCIAEECLSKMSTFNAQSLSHISWAMAQWGTCKDDLMNAVAEQSIIRVSEFPSGAISMIAWSFASLQLKNSALMACISEEAVGKIAQFKTQDLAHLAWAFANLRIKDHSLFGAMAEKVKRSIRDILPPELANIAWAFAKNGISNEGLLNSIAGESLLQIRNFKPTELAMLTWAFAVAAVRHRQLMSEIGLHVQRRIERFTAPQLSNIAWAFGALSLGHTELLQSLSDHVLKNTGAFKAQGLSNIAWAFAMVSFRDERFMRTIAPEIARDVAELRPLALARCAWAYRILAVQSPELLRAILAESLPKVDEFPAKALVKLIDSVCVGPMASEQALLQKALALKIAEVAAFLKSFWASARSCAAPDMAECTEQLQRFGLLDCGIVGTPMLLTQLGIGLPSLPFIRSCRENYPQAPQESGHREFSIAEINVAVADRREHSWVFDSTSDDQWGHSSREGGADGGADWLEAVDLPNRCGRSEITFLVLLQLCHRISELGVERGSPEACAAVEGSVQMLSTLLPTISGVGALLQFRLLFPNVALEFVEQVGMISGD